MWTELLFVELGALGDEIVESCFYRNELKVQDLGSLHGNVGLH